MSERLDDLDGYIFRHAHPHTGEDEFLRAHRTIEIAAHTTAGSAERAAATEKARQELEIARENALKAENQILALKIDTILPFLGLMVELPATAKDEGDRWSPADIGEIFDLSAIHRQLADVSARTLALHDQALHTLDTFKQKMRHLYGNDGTGRPSPSLYLGVQAIGDKRKSLELALINGLLHEQTYLGIMGYDETNAHITVPSLFVDDALGEDPSLRHDAITYSFLRNPGTPDTIASVVGAQVKADSAVALSQDYDSSICLVTQSDMGNEYYSPLWPTQGRPFMTLRALVNNQIGEPVSDQEHATLLTIRQNILGKMEATHTAAIEQSSREPSDPISLALSA